MGVEVSILVGGGNRGMGEWLARGKIEASDPPQKSFISMMACQVKHAINIALYCFSGESGCGYGYLWDRCERRDSYGEDGSL